MYLLIPVKIIKSRAGKHLILIIPQSLLSRLFMYYVEMKVQLIENVFSLTSECVTKRSHSFIIVTSPSVKTVKVQILKTHDNTFFVPLNFIVYLIFLLTRSPQSQCYFELYTEIFFHIHINITDQFPRPLQNSIR